MTLSNMRPSEILQVALNDLMKYSNNKTRYARPSEDRPSFFEGWPDDPEKSWSPHDEEYPEGSRDEDYTGRDWHPDHEGYCR